ncbi:ribosome maturation factor RimP [Allokutzneria sp. A3M-2-11 16]|uniref:ribosome maturation factor RimP n=1 Tax=Allokutzneria sp. A3M-2-11 16 TaxID=2962043 RepID=UPI0020B7AE06|nr:ribosome maturation factor RimP [Allokutzneria sp. A3M-2-11 16]MCP3797848.1 ribosome maturation factor RimP [Allokutzneria sp. A3M-2-11 16]
MSSRQHGGPGPRDQLTAQLEPVVDEAVRAAGFELEQLDVRSAGRRRVLRVVVDSERGVNLDEVADASRSVAEALDAREDVLPDAYTLEVSSRGLDAPLTKPRHWRHTRLRLAKVRLSDGAEFVGRVGDADDEGVQLLVGGSLRRVTYTDIARALVEVEFSEPKAADLALLGANDTTEEESK